MAKTYQALTTAHQRKLSAEEKATMMFVSLSELARSVGCRLLCVDGALHFLSADGNVMYSFIPEDRSAMAAAVQAALEQSFVNNAEKLN